MRNTRIIVFAAIISTVLFGAVIFTACTKKTTCSTVACRNGGVCTNSSCVCPAGYYGNFCELAATTVISYTNNTLTPLSITVNGATTTLPIGKSVAYTGSFGTVVGGTATTSGAADPLGIENGGGIIGLSINWNLNDTFPPVATDTLKKTLGVGATYFFLRMANKSAHNVISYTVNTLDTATSLLQEVTVPNTGTTYDLGYYLAYPNSNVQSTYSNGSVVTSGLSLPMTANQVYTVTVD